MILNYLQNPEKAFELVRQTRSQEGARLVAKFCQTKIGDFRAAIEFLLMAKLPEEAFAEAQVIVVIISPIVMFIRNMEKWTNLLKRLVTLELTRITSKLLNIMKIEAISCTLVIFMQYVVNFQKHLNCFCNVEKQH